jgi:hypothetical protein
MSFVSSPSRRIRPRGGCFASASTMNMAWREGMAPACPRGRSGIASRFCLWRRKGGSTTCRCARALSSGSFIISKLAREPIIAGRRCWRRSPRPAAWSLSLRSMTGKFHTAHRLTLMAHPGDGIQDRQPQALHRDGSRGRQCRQTGLGRIDSRVWGMVMQGLGVLGTRAKHVNRFASSTCAVPAPSR